VSGDTSSPSPAARTDLTPAELYERTPCGLLVLDQRGRVLRANATFAGWLGVEAARLVGAPVLDMLEPGSRLFYETRFLPALELRGGVREVALALTAAGGETLPVLVNAVLDRDTAGDPVVHLAVFPAAERQDYERQLLIARRNAEHSEARTRVLQDATTAFVSSRTDGQLARSLAEIARTALNATTAAVHLTHSGPHVAGGTMPVDTAMLPGRPADLVDDRTIATWSLRGDAGTAAAAALRAARLETALAIPLAHEGVIIGSLACYFAREPELEDLDLDVLRGLCAQAVQSLDRIRLEAELAAIALRDPLTGLANRLVFRSRIAAAVEEADDRSQPLALLFVDLDDFKGVNDELGHTAGDELLRQVADRLTAAVRADDLVCRYGGDEFIVVCRDADERQAVEIAERIRDVVGRPVSGDGWERRVTASIGVTVREGAGPLDGSQLLRLADRAMYRSKSGGKDQVTLIES
jgi:diguanylate cyclase (GGDEF)-like protein/PAS domain S-box-containing protein